jgi:TonB family protein
MKNWRFAPARQNGQPVAAEMELPVLCQPLPKPGQVKVVPAKLIHSKTPEYPIAMRRFGLRGQVLIEFTVDESGRVQNPVIYQSDNPAFDEPALQAIREWKFEPGTRDGKPAAVKQRVPIVFQLETFGGGQNAFTIESHGDQKGLPANLQFDTPAKIRGVLVPVYPYAQRRDDVRGKAKAALLIDPQGRVVMVRVKTADQPEFGLALTAALECFTFDPALKGGKAVAHLVNFEQAFNGDELSDEGADRLLALEKKHPEKIISASALDGPLKPVSRRAPRFPTGVGADVVTGEAMIECLVDEDGRVRLPRVVTATDPAFGYAAVQACAAWWFEQPKAGGKAAIVRVRLPFNFNSTPPKPAKTPAAAGEEPTNPAG